MNNPNNLMACQNGLRFKKMPDEVLVYDWTATKLLFESIAVAEILHLQVGSDIVREFEANGRARSPKILYGWRSTN